MFEPFFSFLFSLFCLKKKKSILINLLYSCLEYIFANLVDKDIVCNKRQETRGLFGSYFQEQFFVLKNMENTKTPFFQRTPKWCSLCFQKLFSRTVFKNRNRTRPRILPSDT